MAPALNIEPKLLERVNTAIAEIRAGKMVILVDDEDRENEGDLTMAAQFVTPQAINFMATHGRGLICLTLTDDHIHRLGIPMMAAPGWSGPTLGTAFTMSIEAQMTTASLPNSDGWNELPNRKRLDPLIRGAMLSGRTRHSSRLTIAIHIIGHAHARHFSASSLAATAKPTMPAPTPVICRVM
jgi:hypothetical protein